MADRQVTCPICDGNVNLAEDVEVSEVVMCPECNNSLVVDSIAEEKITLSQAPEVEEDWGE